MKIGSSKDLSWTVVEAKKKKKNKYEKSSNLQGNENDMEFEVVFPKKEFSQMASSKQVNECEENLNLCINHFSLEKCSSDSSDSEIEVVECPDENSSKNARLYSKILLRNLPLEKVDIPNQLMQSSFEGLKDLLNEENYLEDSDIEILSRTNAQSTLDLDLSIYVNEIEREKKMSNESLEVIFDDNWHAGLFEEEREELITHEGRKINAEKVDDDVKTCLRFCHSKCYCERLFEPIKNSFTKRVNEAGKTNRFSVDSDDEEYGIKKLFETAASDVEDVEDVEDVMTMRTSTLTMLFCITIIVAVHAGNGFGCAFLKDKSTASTMPLVNVIEPKGDSGSVLKNNIFENLNLKSIRASSETKSALKSLLTSFRLLQEKHNQLLDIHDETIKNFNIQKQMTWYWRRKVNSDQKGNIDDKLATKQEPGTHQFLINGYEGIIRKLNTSLEEAKLEAKIWKKKYSSRKLQNIRNHPEILKDKHLPDFSISKCLFLFSNALNIDAALLNLSRPLHVFKKHVRSVWSNIRNSWTKRKGEKETAQFDIDKFRKIFTISNLVSFGLVKEKSEDKKKISEKKRKECMKLPDEFLKNSDEKEGVKLKETEHKISEPKTVFIDCGDRQIKVVTDYEFPEQLIKVESTYCNVKGIAITILKGKVQIVSAVDNRSLTQQTSDIRENIKEDQKYSNLSENEAKEKWYKTKINQLKFDSDLQRWSSDSKVRSLLQDMEQKINQFQREQRKVNEQFEKDTKKFDKRIGQITTRLLSDKENVLIEKDKLFRQLEKLESQIIRMQVEHQFNNRDENQISKTKLKRANGDKMRRKSEEYKSKERINKIAFYKTKLQQVVKELKVLQKKFVCTQTRFLNREKLISTLGKKINNYRKVLQEKCLPNNHEGEEEKPRNEDISITTSFSDVGKENRVPLALNDDPNNMFGYEKKRVEIKKNVRIPPTENTVQTPLAPKSIKSEAFYKKHKYIQIDGFPVYNKMLHTPLVPNWKQQINKNHDSWQTEPSFKDHILDHEKTACKKKYPTQEKYPSQEKHPSQEKYASKKPSIKPSPPTRLSKKQSYELPKKFSEDVRHFSEKTKQKKRDIKQNAKSSAKATTRGYEFEGPRSKLQKEDRSIPVDWYNMRIRQTKTCSVLQLKKISDKPNWYLERMSNRVSSRDAPSSFLSIYNNWRFDLTNDNEDDDDELLYEFL